MYTHSWLTLLYGRNQQHCKASILQWKLKDQQNQTKEKLLQISTRILGADLKCKANVQKKWSCLSLLNAYKGLCGDLDVEAFHPLPLPQPGPVGSNILPGCGQTAKTLIFLWFHLFKASLEVQNFIQFFKRGALERTSFTVAIHPHKIRPAFLQLGLLIFQVPVIYACCSSTTVSVRGNSSC